MGLEPCLPSWPLVLVEQLMSDQCCEVKVAAYSSIAGATREVGFSLALSGVITGSEACTSVTFKTRPCISREGGPGE